MNQRRNWCALVILGLSVGIMGSGVYAQEPVEDGSSVSKRENIVAGANEVSRDQPALFAMADSEAVPELDDAGTDRAPPARRDVEEVIVTAQRRSQNALDVPISLAAFGPEALENMGINSTQDLTTAVPGLNFSVQGLFAQPVIRGISTQGSTGTDSSVAMYIDGVYMPTPAGALFELSDVEGIEVLKGPQGTLYGRNASGGAILVKSRSPSFDPNGELAVGYGRFDERKLSTFVTGPVGGDSMAASFAGYYRARDAYIDDLLRGGKVAEIESYAYRAKLLAQVSDNARFTLSGYRTLTDDPTAYAGNAKDGNSLSRLVAPDLPVATEPHTSTADLYPYLVVESTGFSLNGEIDLGWGNLTTTTGFTNVDNDIAQDADQGPAPALGITGTFPSKSRSQEVSVATDKFGAWSFVLGASYFDQEQSAEIIINEGSHIYGVQDVEAYAAYGEAEWNITDRLTGIAGLRFSTEDRDYVGFFGQGAPRPTTKVADASDSWDSVTPRLTFVYAVNDNVNVFATYNEAFKSGTFNLTSLINEAVKPEEAVGYELGLKAGFSRIGVNAAVFRYELDNLQVATTVTKENPDGTSVTSSVLQNAASAEINGAELEGWFQWTDSIKLSAGLSYLDHQYVNFQSATVNVPLPSEACPGPYPCGNQAVSIDASGKPISRTPDLTANINIEYATSRFGGDLRANLTGYHNSGFGWEIGNRLRQGAYSTLGANVAWRPAGSSFEYSVWGRSLTDEVYAVQSSASAGSDLISFADPITYGVKIKYEF